MLEIKDLEVSLGDKKILKKLSLTLKPGEIHALMGPNGSGKSTLSQAIMGNPQYKDNISGEILLDGVNVLDLTPDERAKKGIFLSFQTPVEIPGVRFSEFLKQSYTAVTSEVVEVDDFRERLKGEAKKLNVSEEFIDRDLNAGLSGGEKKKMEMLQMLVLKPKYIIVDEVDSGLDIDALKVVAKALNQRVQEGAGVLIITHYKRILEYVKPDRVSVIKDGKIAAEGGEGLIDDLEKLGYDPIKIN
jgi:Fe-S cluster assembly ATP-binding protein